MNFYKHHIGDYDADTSHLSWDEDMAYTRMIRTYYRREKPLPEDVKEVCRLVRATSSSQRKAVETVLQEFFTLESDGWHQKRCDGELSEATRKAELNRSVGKLGGRPRKSENPEITQMVSEKKPTENQDGFDSVSRNNPSQTPDSRLQSIDARASRLPADWTPDQGEIDFCKSERPDLNPRAVAEQFRDYWVAQPGAKGRKLDWSATWRNWVRNQRGDTMNGHASDSIFG